MLTGVAFLILMLFLDRNNLISQYRMRRELNGLKKELKFYQDQAEMDSITYHRLMSDTLELEKLGREKYLMKRDSEDIYIIVRKPDKDK